MKIAIIGRTSTLLKAARLLSQNGHEITAVITAKAAPEYSANEGDFEIFAREVDADFFCTSKIIDCYDYLINSKIDIGISLNYSSTISKEVVSCFRLGILNAHLGDLPRYRGNATPNWAIINGEKSIPLCVQYMIGGELDSGDILYKSFIDILETTKIRDIYDAMDVLVPKAFLEVLGKLEIHPKYILETQKDSGVRPMRCYPRIPSDSRLDWRASNLEILRLVNASSDPFSGAYTTYGDKTIVIDDVELFNDDEEYCAVPGQVSHIDRVLGFVVVITGAGKIKINSAKVEGLKVNITDIVRSIRIRFV